MTAADRAVSWLVAVLVAVLALVLLPVDLLLGLVDRLRRRRGSRPGEQLPRPM